MTNENAEMLNLNVKIVKHNININQFFLSPYRYLLELKKFHGGFDPERYLLNHVWCLLSFEC